MTRRAPFMRRILAEIVSWRAYCYLNGPDLIRPLLGKWQFEHCLFSLFLRNVWTKPSSLKGALFQENPGITC